MKIIFFLVLSCFSLLWRDEFTSFFFSRTRSNIYWTYERTNENGTDERAVRICNLLQCPPMRNIYNRAKCIHSIEWVSEERRYFPRQHHQQQQQPFTNTHLKLHIWRVVEKEIEWRGWASKRKEFIMCVVFPLLLLLLMLLLHLLIVHPTTPQSPTLNELPYNSPFLEEKREDDEKSHSTFS
jgi:hypothetical protein